MKTLITFVKFYPIVVTGLIMVGIFCAFKFGDIYSHSVMYADIFYSRFTMTIFSLKMKFCLWHHILLYDLTAIAFVEVIHHVISTIITEQIYNITVSLLLLISVVLVVKLYSLWIR